MISRCVNRTTDEQSRSVTPWRPSNWGHGYATEAVESLCAHLFAAGATRIWAMVHPDNVASALVLERTGFRFEGQTRLSHWVGDENTDDRLYGLVRDDWEAWQTRPRHEPTEVSLHPVDRSNAAEVGALETHKTQEAFVAPMAKSYRDALLPGERGGHPVRPWMRAVRADGELVGFVMVALADDGHDEPYLWRLLIDRLQQRPGIGRRVLDLIVAECRTMGGRSLLTSWGSGRGSPGPFYLAYGFEPTGNVIGAETEARYSFSTAESFR